MNDYLSIPSFISNFYFYILNLTIPLVDTPKNVLFIMFLFYYTHRKISIIFDDFGNSEKKHHLIILYIKNERIK